jgi:DNA-binding NarL/FixJ family response regulator
MIRVLVADDHALMRAAFRTILGAGGFAVIGEAADGDAALIEARRSQPDVVLMDVRMPGRDGLSATAQLASELPAVRVLVLTTFDDDEVLYGALERGAAGFLLKNASPEELLRAVARVAAGDSVLDPAVTGRVMARLARPGSRRDSGVLLRLTEREKDVLALVARGFANSEIAERLTMGEQTVKTHVSRVLAKLGARDRVQAVIAAYETGFVDDARFHR